ncbi:Uncharacterised protein [Mycobacteroides abscessus subsp. abscessus]|nr:Uncharacterised protein [Mycobacteroides abscessus subsp. abscessus]SHY61235.1 Uncharacterised protein [Mycobacteroides abscessus subsp. bolletii]SHU89421.1 Uncharacterised protein [Mycobacteroides abscessus subsp. abscessus]SHW76927.1 Uncharacterised protein [Mycobacteroides abscessus subsp. abscessus]SHX62362.1 Uncharacterised protein [Mycobacteroides abscessus subsp. abscessus]
MITSSSDTEQPSRCPVGMADRLAETTGAGACPVPPGAVEVSRWYITEGDFSKPYTRTIEGKPVALEDWVRFVPSCIQSSNGTTRSVVVALERTSYDGRWLDTGLGLNADETRALARQLDAMADRLDSWAGER